MPDAIAPDGSEIYFRAVEASRASSLVEVVLGPGRTSSAVRHRTVEEIWYFLGGSGQVWVRSPDRDTDRTRRVVPGDVVVIPTGWAFQFRALSVEPLRFLCFTTPAWPGDDEAERVADGGLGEASLT